MKGNKNTELLKVLLLIQTLFKNTYKIHNKEQFTDQIRDPLRDTESIRNNSTTWLTSLKDAVQIHFKKLF